MLKHEDGSVTLSKDEFTEVGEAYGNLYYLLTDMPSSLEDFFNEHKDYVNVVKWEAQLSGGEFDPKEYEENDEEYEENLE